MIRATFARHAPVSRKTKLAGFAAALAVCGGFLAAEAASPFTLRTIDIDGQFGDWDAVLANPRQTTRDGDGSSPAIGADCSLSQDRDCPQTGGAGNDLQTFAWTYDDDAVYLYIERFPTGILTTKVDFFFVADVDRDLRLRQASNPRGPQDDIVIHAYWEPQQGTVTVKVADYLPADAVNGDPIVCETTQCGKAPQGFVDGYMLAGEVGVLRDCPAGSPCAAAPDADKLQAEIRIPWSAFGAGVSKETPFNWHVVSSNNGHIQSSVDNIGAPDGKLGSFILRGVSLVPDRSGAALAGGSVTYLHSLVNDGNDTDFFNLSVTDSMNAKIEIYDGATRLGVDEEGDAHWEAADLDQDGDGRPDVTLAAGIAKELTVVITMPERSGTDTTRITAESGNDSTVSATATDSTFVGSPAFLPPHQDGYTVENETLRFKETLLNGQGVQDTFELTATGCSGYRIDLARDDAGAPGMIVATQPDGGGSWAAPLVDPTADSDADSSPDLGPIAASTMKTFWLLVTPPLGKGIGSTCALTLSGHSDETGATAVATHSVIVSAPVTLTPDYVGNAKGRIASGSSVFLPVLLRNATPVARAFAFSQVQQVIAGMDPGVSPRVWDDPDGDGSPNDGSVVTESDTLPPFGGAQHLLVELRSTDATAAGTILRVTTTATALDDPSISGQEVAEALVGHLALYRDALHTDGSDVFPPCATIYSEGRGLAAGTTDKYRLDWADPAGAVVTTVDPWVTEGDGTTVDATYVLPLDAQRSRWEARLLDRSGATPLLVEVVPFDVELDGTIAALSTDKARYSPGEAIVVTAFVRNDGRAVLEGTSLQYSGAATRVRSSVVARPGESVSDPFTLEPVPALAPGLHPLTLEWRLSCGGEPIATRTTSIAISPTAPTITWPAQDALLATATPTFEGTGSAGATVTVSVASQEISTTVAGDGSWSATVPVALAEGSHTATATQSVEGVPSDASAPRTFTVDTVPPDAPAITSPVGPSLEQSFATNDPVVAVAGTAGAGEPVAVQLDGAGDPRILDVVDGQFADTLTLEEGEHVLTARARDAAGNVSAASASVHVVVDTHAPAPPEITSPQDGDAFAGTLFVSGDAEAAPTEVQVTVREIESSATTTVTASRNGAEFSAAFELPEGSYEVTAVARDRAGNVSESSIVVVFEIDRSRPDAPDITSPSDGQVLTAADAADGVAVAGTAEPGAVVTVVILPLSVTATAQANALGDWATTFAGVPDALTYLVSATARDAAGNDSDPSDPVTFGLDVTPPVVTVLAPDRTVLGIAQLPGGELVVGGTADTDPRGEATVDVTFAGTTHTVTGAGGSWSTRFDLSELGVDPAGYEGQLRVVARDVAGNSSGETTLLLAIDQTPPTPAATLAGPTSPTSSYELPFTGTVPADAVEVALFDAGNLVTTVPVPGGGSFAFEVEVETEGTRTYTARAIDAAGNEGELSGEVTISVDWTRPDAPTILTPSEGAAFAPGTIHVTGTAEPGATITVTVAGTVVQGTTHSVEYDIEVPVPEGTHTVSVVATDAAGNTSDPAAVTVTARSTEGSDGGGGCGCGHAGAAPGLLAFVSLLAAAPRRRRRA